MLRCSGGMRRIGVLLSARDIILLALLLVGTISCLVSIIVVSKAKQATAAVSIGAVWATTCGVLALFIR
jgi:hypothetical protein